MFLSQIYRLPILTFTHLGFVLGSVSMTAPWPLVGSTRLQLMWDGALQCFSEVAPESISFCLLP